MFELAGLPGIALAGWLSDRHFDIKRGGISLISGFGSFGAVVQEFAISRNYDVKQGLGPVFAMLFASAVLATLLCAALARRNRHGKGI